MIFLSHPAEQQIQTQIIKHWADPFSYAEVGATRGSFPAGYAVLRGRIELGHGAGVFSRAQQAVHDWKMFAVPGVHLCWPDAPIAAGTVVAIAIQHFGFCSLNFCRIVYVINEDGPVSRFGFAYGTLKEHFESGEEKFAVEWDKQSDVISYDISSFSKPGKLLTWLALPAARRLQRRFLHQSLEAMKHATEIAT
jgi:uncharacterized protein (UPF0548 family)